MNNIEGMDQLLENLGVNSVPPPSSKGVDPRTSFGLDGGVIVEEWKVIEPRRVGNHYQFKGTIVNYKCKQYELRNPSDTHCLAYEIGKPQQGRGTSIPVTYNQLVEAYSRARG